MVDDLSAIENLSKYVEVVYEQGRIRWIDINQLIFILRQH